MTSSLVPLLAFAAVIAAIPVALWLLKRTPLGGAAAAGVTRTIGVLPLSANQRLVTIEVGTGDARRWLVLGVTAQNITTLHTMEPQAEPPSVLPAAPFAQLLSRLRQDKGAGDAR